MLRGNAVEQARLEYMKPAGVLEVARKGRVGDIDDPYHARSHFSSDTLFGKRGFFHSARPRLEQLRRG